MIARYVRLAWHEAVYLAYRTGLRGYCFPCDRLRWRWTHRRCARRAHAAAAALAAALKAARWCPCPDPNPDCQHPTCPRTTPEPAT